MIGYKEFLLLREAAKLKLKGNKSKVTLHPSAAPHPTNVKIKKPSKPTGTATPKAKP